MNFWAKITIWILWLALFMWWVLPMVDAVKERIVENNKQLESALSE